MVVVSFMIISIIRKELEMYIATWNDTGQFVRPVQLSHFGFADKRLILIMGVWSKTTSTASSPNTLRK